MNHQITPRSIAAPVAAYAHAVLSDSPGRLLHTSGVVPVGPDGTAPGGVAEQARVVWSNIGEILAAADMAPA
ncbi:MAG: RidA family protein, partial [Acidimicrobiales bacterium]